MNAPIIICAQQRSGTTVLQNAIGSTEEIHNFGEIFHQVAYDKQLKHSFFMYKERLIENQPKFITPKINFQARILNRYLNHLSRLSEKPNLLLDIKYNSWHHLNPIWFNYFDKPLMLKLLMERNSILLHIIRRNKFEQFVSSETARKRQLWHLKPDKNKNIADVKLNIDHARCINFMENSLRIQNLFAYWISEYENSVSIYYEDMFDVNGDFNAKTLKSIQEKLLLSSAIPKKPLLEKINSGSIQNIVENYQELKLSFLNTKYESFFN